MFGWDESAWIGKPFIYLVHPDDRPGAGYWLSEEYQIW
jgi:hypothetical protein